jgi:hypothetical protein
LGVVEWGLVGVQGGKHVMRRAGGGADLVTVGAGAGRNHGLCTELMGTEARQAIHCVVHRHVDHGEQARSLGIACVRGPHCLKGETVPGTDDVRA